MRNTQNTCSDFFNESSSPYAKLLKELLRSLGMLETIDQYCTLENLGVSQTVIFHGKEKHIDIYIVLMKDSMEIYFKEYREAFSWMQGGGTENENTDDILRIIFTSYIVQQTSKAVGTSTSLIFFDKNGNQVKQLVAQHVGFLLPFQKHVVKLYLPWT